MSDFQTVRYTGTHDITVTNSIATCDPFRYALFAGGQIHIGSTNLTSIAWYASDSKDGTYLACYASDGTTALTTTINANRSITLPDGLYGRSWIKGLGTFSSGTTEEVTIEGKS